MAVNVVADRRRAVRACACVRVQSRVHVCECVRLFREPSHCLQHRRLEWHLTSPRPRPLPVVMSTLLLTGGVGWLGSACVVAVAGG